MLGKIVRTVKEAFGYVNVGIGLVEGNEVVSRAEAGAFEEKYNSVRVPLGHGVWGWVAQNGRSLISDQMDADWNHEHFAQEGIHSHVCVPLKLKNTVIGVMSADSDRVGAFDRSDEIILQTLANQVSVAIDNVRLYEKEKQVAILEERQRLGRELHDSVTQSLYGISLYAQAALGKLAANRPEQTRQYLDDIQNTAQESLADMRLLIFELRPPILEKEGLIPALQNRLISVENRATIKASLQSNLTDRLSPETEEGLYQIAREALNNILKHAQAKTVLVKIQQEPSSLWMDIVDDGIGFDPGTAGRAGCLGLGNMQEHAQSRGWQFQIESSPGNGTRLRVEIKRT